MSHFIEKCECGIILGQCRCPDPNKNEHIVKPCTHKASPSETQLTLQKKVEEITTAVHFDEVSPEIACDNLLALFQQTLTSLKRDIGKMERHDVNGATDPLGRYQEGGWNDAISKCQRVIEEYLK